MTRKSTSLCLGLLILALGVLGCQGIAGTEAEVAISTTSTAAPTTTTTLSPAQIALGDMTLRQKAAQVLLLTFSGKSLTDDTSRLLAAGPPGGLLILGHNVSDPTQLATLTAGLQEAAAVAGLPVGLFIAVDEEGGKVQRIKQGVPELLSARTIGEESTPNGANDLARLTAIGLLDQGVNMNLAPVADVVADDSSFLYDRTYSADPTVVASFVSAVVRGLQDQGLISVVKHFPGHGSASGNTHTEGAVSGATEQDYASIHLVPFQAAISSGVEGVMVAHIVAAPYDAQNPASLSQAVVEVLLRDTLGFDGLVVTDDISMAAALQSATASAPPPDPAATEDEVLVAGEVQAIVAALNAGCDLVILTELETTAQAVLDGLIVSIEQGSVSQERLDEAVLRILELKYRYAIIAPPVQVSTTTTEPTQEPGQ